MESPSAVLLTPRLELRPITFEQAVAILKGRRRQEIEELVGAEMPWQWPTRVLLEQVFRASLDDIVEDPEGRLWGDRFIVTREGPPKVVGSVIFHGRPGVDGVADIGYGIEDTSQGKGIATEAIGACIKWALAQPACRLVRAETSAWHKPSLRVLEKIGLRVVGEHDADGNKMLVYEIKRPG